MTCLFVVLPAFVVALVRFFLASGARRPATLDTSCLLPVPFPSGGENRCTLPVFRPLLRVAVVLAGGFADASLPLPLPFAGARAGPAPEFRPVCSAGSSSLIL